MKKISDTELKAIIYKHAKWTRSEDGGERADLYGANLRNANLYGANLRNANLCDANLCGANLRGADLYGANLCGADLCGANLRNANLCDADLCSANLCSADLRGANLCSADLRGANLCSANLCSANLRGANLCSANLRGANLCSADLCSADLYGANLRSANLRGANLCSADLCSADLYGANLRNANLCSADLRSAKNVDEVKWNMHTIFYPLQCPETGSFIGYKKASGYIIELEICADAKRSSATSRKCRCSKAKVLSITHLDGSDSGLTEVRSNYSKEFVYCVGEIAEAPDFDENRWKECAAGIHFFITREEAVKYL